MHSPTSDSPQDILSIYLLGTPYVAWGGQPVDIPRRHVRGLLFYLAAQQKPVSRDQLCWLFWPDLPDSNAHRNLTRLLTHLRRALPIIGVLKADEDRVHLDERKIWCDAIELQKRYEKSAPFIEDLKNAAELYSGPLLSGFYLPDCSEYETWLSQERGDYENKYLQVLSSLIRGYKIRQDYAKAILYSQRYLETDELAEEIHRGLILLYALAGDRARALRQYEEFVIILERELGTCPLPETRSIYQAILKGASLVLHEERSTGAQPPWLRFLQLGIPMVGRAHIFHHLERIFLRTKEDRSRIVLITGEPGIGKSRLMHEFSTHCQQNSLVLVGAGGRGEATIPYHPLVEAFRSINVPLPASLAPEWIGEVSRLLPEISRLNPQLPATPPFKGEEARIRLFEGLCRFLSALQAEYGPILLCFDDLHQFDPTSLAWLSYYCRQLASKGNQVMILGTYRQEDARNIKELRDSLARLVLLEEICLEGLGTESILELLHQTVGELPGLAEFAQRLRDATGGNPFFLLEIIRALEEEGKFRGDLHDLVDLPLSRGIREAINRRLDRLTPRARQVLEAGAVLGTIFEFEAARLTAGRNDLETSNGLDELVNRGVLAVESGHYCFSHDLVRRATVAGINPIRLQLLHKRAAKTLEKLYPTATTALAYHYEAAGEWQKALHFHQLSASKAEALFAWQEAEHHLERMLDLLLHLDPGCSQARFLELRGKILEKLARLHYLQGHLANRDDILRRLDDLIGVSKDAELQLLSNYLQAQYLNLDSRYPEAIAAAEAALRKTDGQANPAARFRLLAQMGISYHFLGKPDRALAALQEARNMTGEEIDLRLRGQVMIREGLVKSHLGEYASALHSQKEALATYLQIGDDYSASQCQIEIGYLCANLGRFQEARQALSEVLSFSRQLSARPDEAHALLAWGGLYLREGNYSAAVQSFKEALEILESLRNLNLAASAEAGLGFAYYHLGDQPQSRIWLERGFQQAQDIGHRMRMTQILIELALLELSERNLCAARAQLDQGMSIASEIQSGELLIASLIAKASLERQSGAPHQAVQYAEESLCNARRLGLLTCEMWANTQAGLAFSDLGDFTRACERMRTAEKLVSRAHQRWAGSEEVYLAQAEIFARVGKTVEAGAYRRKAESIIQAKAAYISDAHQRLTYLAKYKSTG